MPSRGLYYKSFTIVIYDRNDNDLYYKTIIVANLALARSVNYNRKTEAYLYERKLRSQTLIVQATGSQNVRLICPSVSFIRLSPSEKR
jgi:hypothetical protein